MAIGSKNSNGVFMQRWSLSFLVMIGGWLLVGCSDDAGEVSLEDETRLIEDYLNRNDIEATQDESGIFYYPITTNPAGNSQTEGQILSVYYTLSVLEGDVIERYLEENGEALRLKQGAGAVYPVGIDAGLPLMKEGETFGFILPSELAFGSFSFSSLIPPNAIIMAEVSLVGVENEATIASEEAEAIENYIDTRKLTDVTTTDSGLRRTTITDGVTGRIVLNGDPVSIRYEATFLNDETFDATNGNETFDFTLGADDLINGLEEGVRSMERGETALLIMPSNLAYRESVRVLPSFLIDQFVENSNIPAYAAQVPPFEVLIFEVTLQQ